jgi:hypothetical protein
MFDIFEKAPAACLLPAFFAAVPGSAQPYARDSFEYLVSVGIDSSERTRQNGILINRDICIKIGRLIELRFFDADF